MQIRNRFDTVTNRKIVKGALISMGGVVATIALQALMEMDFGVYTLLVGAACASVINLIGEYKKGV